MAGTVLTCGGEVRTTGPAGENKLLASEMKRETNSRPTDQRVEEMLEECHWEAQLGEKRSAFCVTWRFIITMSTAQPTTRPFL